MMLRSCRLVLVVVYVCVTVGLYAKSGSPILPSLNGPANESAYYLLTWPGVYTLVFWRFVSHAVFTLLGISPEIDLWWSAPVAVALQQVALAAWVIWLFRVAGGKRVDGQSTRPAK
jgi:hypothetical protein